MFHAVCANLRNHTLQERRRTSEQVQHTQQEPAPPDKVKATLARTGLAFLRSLGFLPCNPPTLCGLDLSLQLGVFPRTCFQKGSKENLAAGLFGMQFVNRPYLSSVMFP